MKGKLHRTLAEEHLQIAILLCNLQSQASRIGSSMGPAKTVASGGRLVGGRLPPSPPLLLPLVLEFGKK